MPISQEVKSYIIDNIIKLTEIPTNSTYSSCYSASLLANNEFSKFVVKPNTGATTSILSKVEKPSNLSYYMNVNLTVYPADTKPEELGKLNCKFSKDKINRNVAEILGLQNPTLATQFPSKQKGGKRSIKKNKKSNKGKKTRKYK